jgi:hypothetical protein
MEADIDDITDDWDFALWRLGILMESWDWISC